MGGTVKSCLGCARHRIARTPRLLLDSAAIILGRVEY
jgi:hypothetical protein